jgi:hypothetical protein
LKHVRHQRLSVLIEQVKGISLADFKKAHPEPFLVIQMMASEDDVKAYLDRSTVMEAASPESAAVLKAAKEMFVTSIVKSTEEPGSEIIIGRSAHSDILIPHLAISRKHATILFDRKKSRYSITDTGSANGTICDNVLLNPNVPKILHSGDTILFGRIVLGTFLLPAAMHEILV